jgi:redox-sensitive bicupin YhaK (pirin superfamily)
MPAPDPTDPLPPGLETVLLPRTHDIGGFEVRRALPAQQRQMVGPFIFFDQMGPGEFLTGKGVDVRPHPHIGLSTITYLFEGEILHRDSLGTEQPIAPGDVNWMTAGRGIAHSERTAAARRTTPHRLSGIQSWVLLPPKDRAGQVVRVARMNCLGDLYRRARCGWISL